MSNATAIGRGRPTIYGRAFVLQVGALVEKGLNDTQISILLGVSGHPVPKSSVRRARLRYMKEAANPTVDGHATRTEAIPTPHDSTAEAEGGPEPAKSEE